jgi:predicted DNA-binding ArsR family transcriptional regulator
MILTVDRKKKFLITMIIIMGCATMINYGLYNILNSYFKNSGTDVVYSNVQLNIIIILMVLGFATVIMVILIPNENVNELMTRMENGGGGGDGAQTLKLGTDTTTTTNIDKEELTEDIEELQSMIDEDLTGEQNKNKG